MIVQTEVSLPLADWLEVVERDYLKSFISKGGAAVKVAVCPPEHAADVGARLIEQGQNAGFEVAMVPSETEQLYRIDRLFKQVAPHIDWTGLARDYVVRGLGINPGNLHGKPLTIDSVAEERGVDPNLLRTELDQVLTLGILRDSGNMSRDFRWAMTFLCRAAIDPTEINQNLSDHVTDWLTGQLRTISLVKSAHIHEQINRYNARAVIASTGAWIRMVGRAGLVVVADFTAFGPSKAVDGKRPPGRIATLDAYEVMREFIDSTDRLDGLFVVFLVGPDFVLDERRGYKAYRALELRLADDVYDRRRVNPLGSMVRLSVP